MSCNRKCRCIVNRPDNVGLTFVAAGADGVVFVKENHDYAKKVFFSKKNADKEAFCLQKLDKTGVAPRFKEYQEETLSVFMERLGHEWVPLDVYIESLGVSSAPLAVQQSLLQVFTVLDASAINPTDYREDNFMVNATAKRVVRIDFANSVLRSEGVRGASTFICRIAPWFPLVYERTGVQQTLANCVKTREQLLQLVARRERLRDRR